MDNNGGPIILFNVDALGLEDEEEELQVQKPARRSGGAMYMPSRAMEQFALAMRDDEELLLMAPVLAFIAEQNRTIQ